MAAAIGTASRSKMTPALDGGSYDVPNITGPIVVQNPRKAYNGVPNVYLIPTAFSSEALGAIGNANPTFIHGPGLNQTDFGISKAVRFDEARSFLIRAEFFNIFNQAQFQNPVANFHSSQFGGTTAYPGRIGQVSAKFIW